MNWTQQELVTFYFDLEAIERPLSGTSQNLAFNGKRGCVAGAEKFVLLRDPVDSAAQ